MNLHKYLPLFDADHYRFPRASGSAPHHFRPDPRRVDWRIVAIGLVVALIVALAVNWRA